MSLQTQGFQELAEELTAIATALTSDRTVNNALKAGAVPIEDQMLQNASTDPKIITDTLHSSIHTGRVRQRRERGKQISIGVHHSESGAYYANRVEYGHGGPAPAPPHPFVRPAFDAKKDEAYDEIKRVLTSALNDL